MDTGPEMRATQRILEARIVELKAALGWFLADERFQVAVGGSPRVVEAMLEDARRILERDDG